MINSIKLLIMTDDQESIGIFLMSGSPFGECFHVIVVTGVKDGARDPRSRPAQVEDVREIIFCHFLPTRGRERAGVLRLRGGVVELE